MYHTLTGASPGSSDTSESGMYTRPPFPELDRTCKAKYTFLTYTYVHIHIHMYIYIYTYIYVIIYKYIHVLYSDRRLSLQQRHVGDWECTRARPSLGRKARVKQHIHFVYIHIYVHMYLYIYIHIYIYIYIYIYI